MRGPAFLAMAVVFLSANALAQTPTSPSTSTVSSQPNAAVAPSTDEGWSFGAAAYTYKYLMKAYPAAPETERARMWLNELPQWAQSLPGPTVVGDEGTPTVEQPVIR